jgi:ubiquinone/menaquinone biosynthesis C-methylase UbiE
MSRAEELRSALGRRFARAATVAVTHVPSLWPLFRRLMRQQFHTLAPRWDTIIGPEHLAPLQAALAALPAPPTRVLDLGTGTGVAAFEIARRFPGTEVLGVDLAEGMVEQATRNTPDELAGRVRFEVADAARLPYESGRFDLVSLANMIPFFDELARVTAPGGHVVLSFAHGAETPIYVPLDRVRDELDTRGFTEFADFAAGNGTALRARKARTA